MAPPQPSDFLPELEWRGLLKDATDREGLGEHLRTGPRRIYAGFDPTADSLTIGNLVPIMLLAHAKRAGHEAVVLTGGGTGLIGDPSGKSAERQLQTPERVEANVAAQRPIFENVLGQVEGRAHRIVNNADWLTTLSYIDVLRDVGKHFSVNMMIQKDSVKSRLEDREQGISYTEFSYMILQAYDFLHLFRSEGISVQCGGSDQYGNIVAGADLIRRDAFARDAEASAFGFTAPLVTKADGGKFGKTESGAIWLTAARTSPYAYYQFWLNCSDEDVRNFLRVFTFLPREEIESLEEEHARAPGKRAAQRRLAQEATTLLHGREEMEQAEAAGRALFSGDIASLNEKTLNEVFSEVPSSEHDKAMLEGADLVDLLVETGLAKSKREAREFVANGSVSINGARAEEGRTLSSADLLHGSTIALRRGKKAWHVTRWA
ncbi:MAG: tyrosine--tRNA ligase [Phycisphaerales bacterium JB059]